MRIPFSGDRLRAVQDPEQPVHAVAYRLLLGSMSLALLTCLVVLSTTEGIPRPALLVTMLAVVTVATQRETFFGDETAISGSLMVICASVVAFHSDSSILGPTLCGVGAGVHWSHVRNRVWSKLVVNSSATGLAAAASASVFRLCSHSHLSLYLFVTIPIAVFVYWLVDNLLIAAVLTAVTGEPFGRRAVGLVLAESELIAFGIVAGGLGLSFSEIGIALGALGLAVLLVVADLNILSRPRFQNRGFSVSRRLSMPRSLLIWLPQFFGTWWIASRHSASWSVGISIFLGTLLSFAIASVGLRRRLGVWGLHLATGVAIADVPLVVLFTAGGLLAAEVDIAVALVFVAGGLAVGMLASRWLDRRRSVEAEHDEDALMTAIEIALLDSHDVSASSR